MATRTPGAEDRLRNLGETLRREIKAARARVTELTARRRDLERHLQAARHAERTAIHSLAALESVSREASGLADEPADEDREDRLVRLAGSELREMIARVALRHGAAGEAVHWRQWLDWLRRSEFDAAGKRPEATFQTQLARSPLVRRTEHDGVYRLDLEQFARARDRLRKLHAQLSQLPPPDQLALLGDVRAQRQHLQNEIARTERAVEEMWRVLVQERPPGWVNDAELAPERLVEAWMAS